MSDTLNLTEDDINNPDVLSHKLITLTEIVIRKHFYASYADKEDLVSIGVLKALTLISEGNWKKSKGSFVNYIYSGIRNDIHNHLYHKNKFSYVDNENVKETGLDDKYFEDDSCYIEYSLIHSICMKFMDSFGASIESKVIKELEHIGYHIKGMGNNTSHTLMQCDRLADDYGEDVADDMAGRIIGLILWEKKEREVA